MKMARKQVTTVPALQSWADVDEALRLIAEAAGRLSRLELTANEQATAIKQAALAEGKPIRDRIAALEKMVSNFAAYHRDELQGKSRRLNFGQLGYRLSTRTVIPSGKEPEIIAALRDHGMDDCIVVTERIDREALRRYPLEDVQRCGADIKQTDRFWYETAEAGLDPAAYD